MTIIISLGVLVLVNTMLHQLLIFSTGWILMWIYCVNRWRKSWIPPWLKPKTRLSFGVPLVGKYKHRSFKNPCRWLLPFIFMFLFVCLGMGVILDYCPRSFRKIPYRRATDTEPMYRVLLWAVHLRGQWRSISTELSPDRHRELPPHPAHGSGGCSTIIEKREVTWNRQRPCETE